MSVTYGGHKAVLRGMDRLDRTRDRVCGIVVGEGSDLGMDVSDAVASIEKSGCRKNDDQER